MIWIHLQLILDLIEARDVVAVTIFDIWNDIRNMLKLFRPMGTGLRQGQPVAGNLTGKALPVCWPGAAEDLDVAGVSFSEGR